MRVALLLGVTVVGDVDLTADDRFDAGAFGRLHELHGASHRAVIGQRDGRHLELGGARNEIRDPASAVEDRVLGVNVKVNERGFRHAERTVYDRPRTAPRRGTVAVADAAESRRWTAEEASVRAPGDDLEHRVDRCLELGVGGEEVRPEPDSGPGPEVADDLDARQAPCGRPRSLRRKR